MITQKKIAEHLKIARTTVSNILRGNMDLKYSEETRRQVLEAAKRFGYLPNRNSISIRRGRSNLIGVLHFGMWYEVNRRISYYLPQEISASGYDVLVEGLSWGGNGHARGIEKLIEARVEGVIVATSSSIFGVEEVNFLRGAGIPVVTLFGNERLGVPAVYEDYADAVRRMTEHVIRVGHRRILLMIYPPAGVRPNVSQAEGFRNGLMRCSGTLLPEETTGWPAPDKDRPVGRIARVDLEKDCFDLAASAYEPMRRLIASGDLPDVIVCGNDHWARGVIAAALEAGLRVPEDVAVTGMDNETFGRYAPYHLTTISKPIERGCERATELLFDLIQGREASEQHFIFPCELVIRKSCGTDRKETAAHMKPECLDIRP